jgi:hypothetical protein
MGLARTRAPDCLIEPGTTQTPLQTVLVQALRNTRLFEGIARGRTASFQFRRTPIPHDPVAVALCLMGIDANTSNLPNKTQPRIETM